MVKRKWKVIKRGNFGSVTSPWRRMKNTDTGEVIELHGKETVRMFKRGRLL